MSDGHLSSSDDTVNHKSSSKPATGSTQKSANSPRPTTTAAVESEFSKPPAADHKLTSSVNHVNSANGDHQALSNIGTDLHDESVKSQLKQLNQSLLNQIESLKVTGISHKTLFKPRILTRQP